MRLARLERLMERRAELLSSVLLRQNPHSVHEWVKRAALFEGDPAKVIGTYATAVKTVDADKAVGKPQRLWLEFARFYEKHDDLRNARVILRKATGVPFKSVDDLAAVWMGWAEMEIRHKKYDLALSVLKEAVAIPPPPSAGSSPRRARRCRRGCTSTRGSGRSTPICRRTSRRLRRRAKRTRRCSS